MKRLKVFFFVALFIGVGCERVSPVKVTDIRLSFSEISLSVGDTVAIDATVLPEDSDDNTILWSSSDDAVATVSPDGVVTAISPGDASITASCSDVSATCDVTVREQVQAEKLIMSKTEAVLVRNDSLALEVTVLPRQAEGYLIEWSSSDETVAEVSDNGVVYALSTGDAVITASIGELSADCSITVEPITESGINLNHEILDLEAGETAVLEVSFIPENTDDRHIVWSSSDRYVASVSEEGLVTAIAVGSAVITATSVNGYTAECVVNVSGEPSIGDYFYSDGTYSAVLNPNKRLVGVVFYTGDPTIDDGILRNEHPECNNGLVVCIEDYTGSWLDIDGARAYKDIIGNWIERNTEYPSTYTDIDDGKMDAIMGYGLTKGLEAFNAADENSGWQVQFIIQLGWFRYDCPDVEGTSGWFMPSFKELDLLCNGEDNGRPDWQPLLIRDLINARLDAAGAEPLKHYLYWSCLELDGENALLKGFDEGGNLFDGKSSSRSIRYITAF